MQSSVLSPRDLTAFVWIPRPAAGHHTGTCAKLSADDGGSKLLWLLAQDKTHLRFCICGWERSKVPQTTMTRHDVLGTVHTWMREMNYPGLHSKVLSSSTPHLSSVFFFLQKPINCVLSEGGQSCSIQMAQPGRENTFITSQHRRPVHCQVSGLETIAGVLFSWGVTLRWPQWIFRYKSCCCLHLGRFCVFTEAGTCSLLIREKTNPANHATRLTIFRRG